jgi:hypothetical protein
MSIEFSADNTLPIKGNYFWQFVIIPTISILRVDDHTLDMEDDLPKLWFPPYTVFNFEWMFWSVTILIR